MSAKKTNAFLNVFLIKEGTTASDKIINQAKCDPPLDIPVTGCGTGMLFVRKSSSHLPKWARIFASAIDTATIGTISTVSAAFLIEFASRLFVLVFGPAGRFLIRDDIFEERFGLLVALNSVDKKTFRCIDKQSFDTIQSHTRIQSSEGTSPDQFGLDVEQDILKAIVGTPEDLTLGTRMTGRDSLVVTVRMDLDELSNLLGAYRDKFAADLNATDYNWVNNITQVGGPSHLIDVLDNKLVSKFINDDLHNLWISVPEIIQWDLVKGFIYTGGKRIIHPDVNLDGFLTTVTDRQGISLQMLKSRSVSCADAEHNPVHKDGTIYKCIYTEIDHDKQKYVLSGGKWFCINQGFVTKTNATFTQITRSSLTLPVYKGGTEGEYNKEVADSDPANFILMDDKRKIFHGGGSGQVEFCDLFSIDKKIIHIKKYGQSSVFSHLFSQGFVSGQLLQLDREFRGKVVKRMQPPFSTLIEIESRPKEQEYTIIFGVISDSEGDDLQLPFFSRVNVNNAAKTLVGFGYKVELLKIEVDETYAKTTICPPRKQKRQ